MRISKPLTFVFLALAFVGFLDATYLTVEHFLGAIPPCVIVGGCSVVLTSEWSVIMGIPVALMGSIYYLALLILTVVYLKTRSSSANAEKIMVVSSFATAIGLLASIFFVSLQLFVIKDICFYCVVSAATSTALFIVGVLILVNYRRLGRATASEMM